MVMMIPTEIFTACTGHREKRSLIEIGLAMALD